MKLLFAICLFAAGCTTHDDMAVTVGHPFNAYEHELAKRALRESQPVTQFPIPPGHPPLTADGLIDLRAVARRQ